MLYRYFVAQSDDPVTGPWMVIEEGPTKKTRVRIYHVQTEQDARAHADDLNRRSRASYARWQKRRGALA